MKTTYLYVVDYYDSNLGYNMTRLFFDYSEARSFWNIHNGNLYQFIVLAQIDDIT